MSSSNQSNSNSMNEVLFWTRFNSAISGFCLKVTLSQYESEKVASSLVGDELEWCGAQAFLFMAQRFLDQEEQLRASRRRIAETEQRCNAINIMLNNEMSSSTLLRKQLKQAQINAEDNEWMLQEQLAQLNNLLQQEREASQEIRGQLAATEAKLVEVESFLSSDRGEVFLKMEEELAEAKLRVAELEANKDDLEMEIKAKDRRHSLSTTTSSSSSLSSSNNSDIAPSPSAGRRSNGLKGQPSSINRNNGYSSGLSESRGRAAYLVGGRSLLEKENARPFPGFGSS